MKLFKTIMSFRTTILRTTALAGILALAPIAAKADTITIDSTVPTWSNAVGGSGIVYNAVNGAFTDVRWGTPLDGGQSGLGFDPTNPPSGPITTGTTFLLGNLKHYNFPIASGSAVSSVDLSLLTNVFGATPVSQTFAFRFFIDETSNVAPCAYPSTEPCADRITFSNLDPSSSFTVGGVAYTIVLQGFSTDGSTFQDHFDSQEGGTNSIGLYGKITAPVETPEPTSLIMLGAGLFSLSWVRRRRQNAA